MGQDRDYRKLPGEGWTDERVELLKTLNAQGLSAGEMAKALGGGLTRNAVIGKRGRMGLAVPATAKARAPMARKGVTSPIKPRPPSPSADTHRPYNGDPRTSPAQKRVIAATEAAHAAARWVEPESDLAPIPDEERVRHHCKFLLTSDSCGRPAELRENGRPYPYCRTHLQGVFAPKQPTGRSIGNLATFAQRTDGIEIVGKPPGRPRALDF